MRMLIVTGLALLGFSGAAIAQSGSLPAGFDQAVAEQRPVAAQTFILSAIAQDASRAQPVLAEAFARAPHYADQFSRTVGQAFPGLQSQIEGARSGSGLQAAIPAAPPSAFVSRVANVGSAPTVATLKPADPDFPPGKGWSGEAQIGGNLSTGNTETEEVSAGVSVQYDGSRWHHELGAAFDYSRDNGQVSAQRLVLDYEPRYDFTKRFYGFGFAEYRNDRFSGFSYELSESLGVGYKLLIGDPVSWLVQAGPALRLSEEDVTGNVATEFGFLAQSDIGWDISDGANLNNETTLLFAAGRSTLTNLTALSMRIVGSLQGRLSFEYRNDSDPVAGTKGTDTVTRATLVYGF
jgi:putative salt-induced outer membrane protein